MNNLFMPKEQKELEDLIKEPVEDLSGRESLVFAVKDQIFYVDGEGGKGFICNVPGEVHDFAFRPGNDNDGGVLYWGSDRGIGVVGGEMLYDGVVHSLEYYDGGLWYGGNDDLIRNRFDASMCADHIGCKEIFALCKFKNSLFIGASNLIEEFYASTVRSAGYSKVLGKSVIVDMCVHDDNLILATDTYADMARQGVVMTLNGNNKFSLPSYLHGVASWEGVLVGACRDGLWDVLAEDKFLTTAGDATAIISLPSEFVRDNYNREFKFHMSDW